MTHHDVWGCVEAVDQQSHFLVDSQVERAQHPRHALAFEPDFGCFEQCGKHCLIVSPFDEAEKPGGVVMGLQKQAIDLR
jgi:hypothetical protein